MHSLKITFVIIVYKNENEKQEFILNMVYFADLYLFGDINEIHREIYMIQLFLKIKLLYILS